MARGKWKEKLKKIKKTAVMLKLRYLIISQMAWRQCYGVNECTCYATCTDEETADMTTDTL